ncbi:hypothetical protein RJT34_26076 [Clitoria ternatea]|uniref:Miraculin n=1 Tax=Clitoria ternatea TaxID=43366 RepID=A0AAN9FBF9_CLITE
MKSILLALALLVALSTKPQGGEANASPEPVVDTSGKKLRAGVNYYIVPSPRNKDVGGLALASTGELCPLDVVLDYQPQPLTFTPVNTKKGVIREDTDLNIMFSATYTSCPQSTVWKLKDYDYSTRQLFVTTGGVLGNPGWQTLDNWFKIEKYEDSYKLVYCPHVCTECSFECKALGIYEDPYGMRLALVGYDGPSEPYKVQFQLAA